MYKGSTWTTGGLLIAKPAYAPWMTRDAKRATVMNVENIIRTKKSGRRRVLAGRRIENGERLKGLHYPVTCQVQTQRSFIW